MNSTKTLYSRKENQEEDTPVNNVSVGQRKQSTPDEKQRRTVGRADYAPKARGEIERKKTALKTEQLKETDLGNAQVGYVLGNCVLSLIILVKYFLT